MIDSPTASPYRRAIVQTVDAGQTADGRPTALLTDLRTGNEFTALLSTPQRIRPQRGDIWVLRRDLGYWVFDSLVAAAKPLVAKNLDDAIRHLDDLGLFFFRPGETPSGEARQSASGGWIGEIREFFGPIPHNWLVCDGAAYSRSFYRLLFDAIGTTAGPGDGSSTFNVPDRTPSTARVGDIRMIGDGTVPSDCVAADGSILNIVDWPDLAAKFGTTWGGNGTTTFGVPDLRGRVPMGSGTGGGLTARTLADSVGAESVTLTSAQSGLPAHNHTQNSHQHSIDHTHGSFVSGNQSASHNHSVSITSGNESNDHYHYLAERATVTEASGYGLTLTSGFQDRPLISHTSQGRNTYGASATHTHLVSGTSGNQSADHTHTTNITALSGNSGAATATNNANTAADAASAHTNIQPSTVVHFVIQASAPAVDTAQYAICAS